MARTIQLALASLLVLTTCQPLSAASIVGLAETTGDLNSIDPSTGATSVLKPAVLTGVYGASQSGTAEQIFATTWIGTLYSVGVSGGTATAVGNFSGATSNIREMGFDPASGVLYGTDYSNLYTINPATAATTFVGNLGGVAGWWAMTYVPGQGLYGVSMDTDTLYQINTSDGSLTTIGATGVDRIIDIAYDPDSGKLIASHNMPEGIYELNLTNGAATLLNSTGVPSMLGIATLIPEPSTLALLAMGAVGLLAYAYRRKR